MGAVAARLTRVMLDVKRVADEDRETGWCEDYAEELEGILPLVERMEDALARLEALCLEAESVWARNRELPRGEGRAPQLNPHSVELIRRAMQGGE